MLQVEFDPWAPEVQADPYRFYAGLRRDRPCLNLPGTPLWVISRYDDVRAVQRDYRRFTSTEGVGIRREETNVLLASDPPEHTKTRRFLQPLFRRDALAKWKLRAEEIVDRLLDEALEAGTVEWRSHLATTLPVIVTGELLGIPLDPEMMDTYVRWSRILSDNINIPDDDPGLPEIQRAVSEAMEWFTEFVVARRAENRPEPLDLIDRMFGDEQGGGYSTADVALLALSILTAGTQTTADVLCHMLVVMDDFPGQWDLLHQRPELAGNAFDELVRYESPQQALWRTALEDVEIAGITVPRHDRVLMLMGSANRDETKWPDGDVFDITRDASGHLGFGIGVHRCIGEPLAKLEVIAALERMARRIETFEFAEPFQRHNTSTQRSFDRMPIALTGR